MLLVKAGNTEDRIAPGIPLEKYCKKILRSSKNNGFSPDLRIWGPSASKKTKFDNVKMKAVQKRVFQAEATTSSRFPGDCLLVVYYRYMSKMQSPGNLELAVASAWNTLFCIFSGLVPFLS